MLTTITARRLITDTGEIEYPVISVEDGKIVRIEAGDANGSTETLTAAFFDIHVHGARSFDFMASDAAGIAEVGRFLVTRGVANYLPTTVTAPLDLTLKALERLADAIEHPSGTALLLRCRWGFIWKGRLCRTENVACILRSAFANRILSCSIAFRRRRGDTFA